MIFPKALQPGDTIAIISPSSTVKPEYIAGAERILRAEGFGTKVMHHAGGPADGSYASTEDARLSDFREAWTDPEVRAILCARGGYGAVHLLDKIGYEELSADPKWLIGFSDISALHARLNVSGIASIHGPMAKHLTENEGKDIASFALLKMLRDPSHSMDYTIEPHKFNRPGCAEGELRGGNLAVLSHLINTPYDILTPGIHDNLILFIEDIGEAIYATERMLWQLHLSGALKRCKGLLVGSFTETRADKNFADTASMIDARLRQWGADSMPVAFGVPVGHTNHNLPLIEGARVRLEVTPKGTHLYSID